MFDDRHDGPELYVPDLSKPQGAAVAADGTAACVACGARKPVAQLDVVGQGYRCAPCSHKAEIAALAHGASDVGHNLSSHDRSSLRSSGIAMLFGGIGLAVLGGILLAAGMGSSRGGFKLSLGLIFAGVLTCGIGVSKMNAAG